MSLLTQLRIGPRLVMSFGIILILLISVSLVSILRLNDLSDTTEILIERDVNRVTVASQIDIEAQAAALILLELLSTPERDQRVNLYRAIDQRNEALNTAINELKSLDVPEVSAIIALREDYLTAFTETVELLELSAEDAIAEFKFSTKPKLAALLSSISELVSKQKSAMQAQTEQAIAAKNAAITLVIIISLVATGLVIILATLVSRSIVTPLNKTVSMAKEIAQGNIGQPETLPGNDETVELNEAFKEMCQGLQALIQSIQHSSQEICNSSNALSEPVTLVKQGSETQHNAVHEIETLISNFAEQADQAVSTSRESIEQANIAKQLSGEGTDLIHKTTREFDVISTTIDNSAHVVESLRESAMSVSNMVNSVREIADQTNLLALNAAIEAARAGESGRGFSVVADEVRNLAVRASEATNQIDEVIEIIMTGTQSAVDRIGKGREEMQDGVTLLNQLVDPLTALSESAQQSVMQLESLENAVQDQAKDSQRITEQIGMIASMARDNQDAIQGVSKATSDMTDLSDGLEQQVKRFTIQ